MVKEHRHNIVIVDGDSGVLETLGEEVARDGYNVFLSGSAAGALEILCAHPASAIVAALHLPGAKGDALLSRAGRERSGIVRLLRAGHEDARIVIRCLREGVIDAFFPLTAPASGLARLLKEMLGPPPGKVLPAASSLVLIIEDSGYFRALSARLLGGRYRVRAAEDGIGGLLAAMAEPPDLVITGLRLAGVSGENVIGFLRRGFKVPCPIIVWELPFLLEGTSVEGAALVVPKNAGQPLGLLEAVERLLPRHPPAKTASRPPRC